MTSCQDEVLVDIFGFAPVPGFRLPITVSRRPGGLEASALNERNKRGKRAREEDEGEAISQAARDRHEHRPGPSGVGLDLREWVHGSTPIVRCEAALRALDALIQEEEHRPIDYEADSDPLGTSEDRASDILAVSLRESNTSALWNCVVMLGLRAVRQLLQGTVDREKGGGVTTADGARRRSPGGVFFYLLKDVASREEYKVIFADKRAAHQTRVNAKRRRGAESSDQCARGGSAGAAIGPLAASAATCQPEGASEAPGGRAFAAAMAAAIAATAPESAL